MPYLRSRALASFSLVAIAATALADGFYLSAPGRRDVAFDVARQRLYISAGGQVLRYDLNARGFLAPWSIYNATDLGGLDISPDGTYLATVDRASQSGLMAYFLQTDSEAAFYGSSWFNLSPYEAGGQSVGYLKDGSVLISGRFAGSGSVPLRRHFRQELFPNYTPDVVYNPWIGQDAMLAVSGDRSVAAFTEGNLSSGPLGWVKDNGIDYVFQSRKTQTNWFAYEIAANRDGTQFSVPTFGGTFVYDGTLANRIATIGEYASAQPIGAAYHPTQPLVYYPFAKTNEVRVYRTDTFQQVGALTVNGTFEHTGNHAYVEGRIKVSPDGRYLAVTVDNGVQVIPLSFPPRALDGQATTAEDTPASVTLIGGAGSQESVAWTLVSGPAHGRVSGLPTTPTTAYPTVTYTPNANYNGPDSFTFKTVKSDGTESRIATVSLSVTPVNDNPVAAADAASTLKDTPVAINVVANDSDVDGDVPFVVGTTTPANGSVTLGSDGRLIYTPKRKWTGTDTFRYTISDGKGGTSAATVTVVVTGGKGNGGGNPGKGRG